MRSPTTSALEILLLEGLDSGDGIEATEDWWNQKRTRLVEQFQPSDDDQTEHQQNFG